MEGSTANTLFTIICISAVPVATLIILFNFFVILVTKQRTIDVVTSTLLIGRLGHACAVVIFMGVYSLENWRWSKPMCQAFVWIWVTFWTLDLFTNILFLLYNALRVGQPKGNVRCHMVTLVVTSWSLAILTGAFTFMTDWMFNNLSDRDTGQGCLLGLSSGEQPIRVAAMFVIIIGGLLLIVLTITVTAESRAQSLKYKLLHPEVISATNSTKRISIRQNGEIVHRDPRDVYQIIDISSETTTPDGTLNTPEVASSNGAIGNGLPKDNSNSNNSNNVTGFDQETEHVRNWRHIDNQMRDLRHIHGAATACTILLNLLPQLVLYSMDSVSGSAYTYGHHILVTAGLVHAVVLPVTFCMTGIRYKASANRLIRDTFSGKPNRSNQSEPPQDLERHLVFHIRDVTLTDSTDTAPEPVDVCDERDSKRDSRTYTRTQMQVLSMRGEPSHARSSIHDPENLMSQQSQDGSETDARINLTTVALVNSAPSRTSLEAPSDKDSTLKGTVNPGYVEADDETKPAYSRSQSDGVVDYYDNGSDEEWGSWDSDSETWSNLYDESDIDEVMADGTQVGSLKSNRLSPNTPSRGRRRSTQPYLVEQHHRRKSSSQINVSVDGQSSLSKGRRKSVDGSGRKRRKRSRHRRRGSRDLVGDLAPMMQLGIASAVITKSASEERLNQSNDMQEKHNGVTDINSSSTSDNLQYDPLISDVNVNRSNIEEPCVCYCGPDNIAVSQTTQSIRREQSSAVSKRVSFGSELTAAANKFRRSYDEQETRRIEQIKMNELVKESRKTRNARTVARVPSKSSTARLERSGIPPAPPLPGDFIGNAPKKPARTTITATETSLENGNLSRISAHHDSNASEKRNRSILRKHSSAKSVMGSVITLHPPVAPNDRSSAPVPRSSSSQGSETSRPQSHPQNIDPMLADMTLSKIMTNPFLTDILRQSLESLDSAGQDETTPPSASKPGAKEESSSNTNGQTDSPQAPNPFKAMVGKERSEEALAELPKGENKVRTKKASDFASKGRDKPLYEIPSIDSDHRYRQRKPIRRGLYAFRAAARAVAISEFLKKSSDKMQNSEIERNSSTSGSFSVSSDLHYI